MAWAVRAAPRAPGIADALSPTVVLAELPELRTETANKLSGIGVIARREMIAGADGRTDVGTVEVCREHRVKGQMNERDYLTSLWMGATELAGYIRNHRDIEDGFQWLQDVAFRKDNEGTRSGRTAPNGAAVEPGHAAAESRWGEGDHPDAEGEIETARTKFPKYSVRENA